MGTLYYFMRPAHTTAWSLLTERGRAAYACGVDIPISIYLVVLYSSCSCKHYTGVT